MDTGLLGLGVWKVVSRSLVSLVRSGDCTRTRTSCDWGACMHARAGAACA